MFLLFMKETPVFKFASDAPSQSTPGRVPSSGKVQNRSRFCELLSNAVVCRAYWRAKEATICGHGFAQPRTNQESAMRAFLSDRDGPIDVWVTQVGSGEFHILSWECSGSRESIP
jgi:hypothetical protein